MTRALAVVLFVAAAVTCACGSSAPEADVDAPRAQDGTVCGPAGLQHGQPLMVGELERHYMLYVPASYRCDGPAVALVIDFHGTWSGSDADDGEEYYALPGAMAAADAGGFILARPRSLSSDEGTPGGAQIFRWDENPGDYGRNVDFAHALVAQLESAYAIDPARVYALGFSSGTGMTAQLFADDPQVFHGYAFVGGGVFPGELPASFHVDPAARMYGVSGYRDYLFTDERALLGLLDQHGFPRGQYFQRTDNNGHELYGWHYAEAFGWLDAHARPPTGTLASAWSAEATGAAEDLTAVAGDGAGSGGLVATGGSGGIFRRDGGGTWSRAATLPGQPGLAAACILASGEGVAVGESAVGHTTDHGATWSTDVAIPQFVPGYFDVPYLNAVGCSSSELVTVGYWDAAHSGDAATWSATAIPADAAGTYVGQGAQVRVGPTGTWIAAGYYYLGRSTDGVTFAPITLPLSDTQWLMGVAAAPGGRWWAVGDAGAMIASTDDGLTWQAVTVPTTEDLYAIAFAPDGQHGLATGAHGVVLATRDGGATWTDRSTGLDAFIGDVAWLDDHTALVVGGDGLAATTQLP